MEQQKFKRRKKLIRPSLQLKLIGAFMGLTALALLTHFLLVTNRLMLLSADMPTGGRYVADETPGLLLTVLGVSYLVVLPTIFFIGVRVTFKIAGPVHRFEEYLSSVAQGSDPGPCKIRKGDELQNLCALINAALETARSDATADDVEQSDDPRRVA